jgi:hypothetical protein
MTAIDLIRTERQRQIDMEAWTPEHDDTHEDGELLRAGVIYIWHGTDRAAPIREDGAPFSWPWDVSYWKPRDRRSNLVRGGALCLAEKERLERAGKHTGAAEHKLEIALRELESLKN